jgi:hypothetical protein
VNLTISIFAVVSIRSFPTIKFSGGAAECFATDELAGGAGKIPGAFVATSRGGPLSFSFRTCKSRMMQNGWFVPAI